MLFLIIYINFVNNIFLKRLNIGLETCFVLIDFNER